MTTDDKVVDAAEIQSTFRRMTPERHPILAQCTRDVVYDEGRCMAPGGLVLADAVGRHLDLQPGQSVLDLGCGRASRRSFSPRGTTSR